MAIQATAFSNLPVKTQSTSSEACNTYKSMIALWNRVKQSPPPGPLHLKYLMENQESLKGSPTNKNVEALFQGINSVFGQCLGATFGGEMKIYTDHFHVLQLELYRQLADKSLMASWERIWHPIDMWIKPSSTSVCASSHSTPSEVRQWLYAADTEMFRAMRGKIDLSNLGIRYVPEEICQFPNLQTLNLSGNHIDVLPSFLGKIPSLRTLSLSDNYLDELPSEFAHWTHIETLDVSNNPLKSQAEALVSQRQRNQELIFEMAFEGV